MLVEILLALIGHSGDLIGKDFKVSLSYVESELISSPEAANINRLVYLGKLYSTINDFVEKRLNVEFGGDLVIRGLCAGLKELLSRYHEKVCHIEQMALRNPKLTVGKVKFHLSEYFTIFEAVVSFIIEVLEEKDLRGGQILQQVHLGGYYLNSDPIVTQVFERILSHCHLVWMNMVEAWMCHGLLIDPHDEFFVQERSYQVSIYENGNKNKLSSFSRPGIKPDETLNHPIVCEYEWKSQFTLRHSMIPVEYIKISTAEKILFVGKAVRVLQRVSKSISNREEGLETFISSRIIELKEWCREKNDKKDAITNMNKFIKSIQIENAVNDIYAVVAKRLWKLVVKDAKLIDHLDIVRQFFLLGRGEFFRAFVGASRSLMASPPRPSLEHAENAIRSGPWRDASVESGVDNWPEFQKENFGRLKLHLLKPKFCFGSLKSVNVKSNNSTASFLSGFGHKNVNNCANLNVDGKLVLVGNIKSERKMDSDDDVLKIFGDRGGVWFGRKVPVERGFESFVKIKRIEPDTVEERENRTGNIFSLSEQEKTQGEIAVVMHHDIAHGPTALGNEKYGHSNLKNSISVVISFAKREMSFRAADKVLNVVPFQGEIEDADIHICYELAGEQRPKWVLMATLNNEFTLRSEIDLGKIVEFERGSGRAWVGVLGGIQNAKSDNCKPVIEISGWSFESRLYGEQSAEFDSWRDILTLQYKVQWPIQLILTQDSLEFYGLVFRFLLAVKRVGDALKESWGSLNQKKIKQRCDTHRLNLLRQRMHLMIKNLQFYLHVDVINTLAKELIEKISCAPNYENVVMAHEEFLEKIITKSCLHNKVVKNSLNTVLRRCHRFCGLINRLASQPDSKSAKADLADLEKAFNRDANFLKYIAPNLI